MSLLKYYCVSNTEHGMIIYTAEAYEDEVQEILRKLKMVGGGSFRTRGMVVRSFTRSGMKLMVENLQEKGWEAKDIED